MEKYSEQAYRDLDCDDYRVRFPDETKSLTDEQLYDIVAATEDDMSDAEWRLLLTKQPA